MVGSSTTGVLGTTGVSTLLSVFELVLLLLLLLFSEMFELSFVESLLAFSFLFSTFSSITSTISTSSKLSLSVFALAFINNLKIHLIYYFFCKLLTRTT